MELEQHHDSASPFDAIRQVREDGTEYWSARDLMGAMGYSTWQKFATPLERAMSTARNQGQEVETLFNRSVEKSGGRPRMVGVPQIRVTSKGLYKLSDLMVQS